MTLTAGRRLGPYEIQSALGAGGMGEVFRARDSRLGREVAIKVLPALFAGDPERLARFEREAQLLASLNHPNIGSIYGLEESGSVKALVLELVEGPTLADRLVQAPLPIGDALPIARQIADALETAHGQGIIHRDLKPANIKVRADGTVKVLDFGLAKALDTAPSSSADAMNSPTLTARATRMGIILGTAAYMAPEQAKGKPVDKRADIWAFGCVLYEMLTGRRAFDGEDVSDTLAFVITREPDWTALPANTPTPIVRLLRRCLEKDRKRRLSDIADARLEIDDAVVTPGETFERRFAASEARPVGWQRVVPWATAIMSALALLLVLVFWAPWRRPPLEAPVRLTSHIGVDSSLNVREGSLTQGPGGAAAIALSPDGNVFAFTAVTAGAAAPTLHVRRLDQFSAIPLPGTEGAYAPFFSPDGQSIAFFADGKLKRIPVTGGATMTLADAPSARGGSWSEDGTIVFSPDRLASSLLRVPESGGAPEPITTRAEDEAIHRWPQVLPDGRGVLYTSHSHTSGMDNANLVVQPLPRGDRKIVLKGGYHGRYVHSGHIVYIRDSTLFAAPFDLDRLETTGPPVPVVEEVTSGNLSGSAQYAVSNNGTLLYVSGGVLVQGGPIEWMDRKGTRTPLRATSAYTNNLTFSPDGARLALDLYDGKQWDIWVYEWARDRPLPFRFDAANESKPIWTADGRRITFASSRGNLVTPNLYWQLADGAGEAQRLTDSRNPQRPGSWHPSGRFLAFFELTPEDSWDLMILPMEGDATSGWKPGKPTVFMSSPFAEIDPVFSRDGRWLAYHSNESGRDEVTVAPFPGPGPKLPVSTGGGSLPTWSPVGDELFYIAGTRIMVVPFKAASGSLQFEKPRPWSDGEFNPRTGGPLPSRGFDLHPAGERFALTTAEVTAADRIDHVNVVFNFFDELRRLAPSVKR